MKIGVLGLWHLGEIYSAGLSELNHKVVGLSDDFQAIENLRKNKPPLPEPKLESLLRKHQKEGNLSFTSDFSVLKKCDVLWLTFDIPVGKRDKADPEMLFEGLKKSLPYLKEGILIIVSSQLEVGTSENISEFVKKKSKKLKFEYAYVPENLRLGEALDSFLSPGRIVIGADRKETAEKVKKIFRSLKTDFLVMKVVSAEMVKHALNSFLAASLSFIYDISDICEKVGADVVDVAKALRTDPRIGLKAYLDASIGFSGGTLGRDLQFLSSVAKSSKIQVPVIEAVFKKNEQRRTILYRKLRNILGGLKGKKIAVFGLTYKAGTSTLRRSLALDIIRDLENMGARLSLYDPHIRKDELVLALRGVKFRFLNNPYDAVKKAHAFVVVTPWKELKELDFKRCRKIMERTAVFFDARNFFCEEEDKIKMSGLNYLGIGR